MDARLDLFRALGLDAGQAHVLRNAGGRASEEVSTHLLETREIGVIHHTNCGLDHGVTVWGAVYDVDTGGLMVVVEPRPVEDGSSQMLHRGQP